MVGSASALRAYVGAELVWPDLEIIKELLFSDGETGGIWIPTLSPAMIANNTLGSGVETLLDLQYSNNATQATPANRPAWMRVPEGGRRNLATPSFGVGNYNDGSIFGVSGVPATAGATDPQGGSEAVTLNWSGVQRRFGTASVASGIQIPDKNGFATISLWMRAVSGTVNNVSLTLRSTTTANVVTTTPNLTTDWQHVTLTRATVAGQGRTGWYLDSSGTSSVEVWGYQLEANSTTTPYQRVTTVFDVTESGKRSIYGLWADGIDDGMQTPSIDFSGTDKVTVFWAGQKLSDAGPGLIASLGLLTSREWRLFGPHAATPTFQMSSRGNGASRAATSPSSFPSGQHHIVVGQAQISAPMVNLRIDGQGIASDSASQGSLNYSNTAIRLFAFGSSYYFTGQTFALIVAGDNYPLSTIQEVEKILAKYTPGVTL